jgi:hypothetical protein
MFYYGIYSLYDSYKIGQTYLNDPALTVGKSVILRP